MMRLRKNIILLALLLAGFAGYAQESLNNIASGTKKYSGNTIIPDKSTRTISGSNTIVVVEGDLTIGGQAELTVTGGATLIVNNNLLIDNKGKIFVSNGALVMIMGTVHQDAGQAKLDNSSYFVSGGLDAKNGNFSLPDPKNGGITYMHGTRTYGNPDDLDEIISNLNERLERENVEITMPDFVTTTLQEAGESILPLPIELTYFVARQTSEGIKFEWQTASEKDNDYFTIEYSTDALNFSELATVRGAGTSTEIINYEYNYSTNATGVMYYRLRQTDYDGQSDCSDIVALTFAEHQTANVSNIDIKVYPNPATDYVQIKGDGIVSVEFVNASGRVLSAAGLQASYSISNLPQGINYVIIHTTQGNAIRQFIKH